MEDNTAAPAIIRMPEVKRTVGLSRATIYNRMKQGTSPAAVPLGDAAVGWRRAEVRQWIAERVNERDAQTSAAA